MIEPNTLTPFKSKQKTEGPYSEKSPAELQMILRDATQYNDAKVVEAVQDEINARNGFTKPVVKELETIVEKTKPVKTTKKVKSVMP